MSEIRLIINRHDDTYSARWVESRDQESHAFPLALPLAAADMDDLRWYLETYLQFPGAGDHARAQGIERQLVQWGNALFQAAFGTNEGIQVYNNFMDEPEPRRLTIGATDPDVLARPWELMRDRRGPLAFQGVTMRRQLQGSGRTRRFHLGRPLRVLLIVSRPTDAGFIDPRTSLRPVMEALEALPAGFAQVDFCDPPTFARLEELVSQARKAQAPYHVVHFDGHGTYLPRTGVGALAFEKEDASTELIAGRQVGDLMARLNVPLVILEACRSSGLSQKPVFGSVAPALLQSGVGSVVAFSHAVHVEAARLLVERFYRELGQGRSVGQALEEARARLHANRARWLHRGPGAATVDLEDWFIPQLYQTGADPILITKTNELSPSITVSPGHLVTVSPLHNFPPPPLYQFHGRALELLELERAFRRYPAVVASGMGGMGKTALAREAAAWWLRTGRFEAAVFHSFEQKAGAERVVQLLGQALQGGNFSALPAEEQWQTAVRLFQERRVLLVWDNFESTLPAFQTGDNPSGLPEQSAVVPFAAEARAQLHQLYRDLVIGHPSDRRSPTLSSGGRLLVTCRPQDTGLPRIKEMALQGLARPDSLYLLAACWTRKASAWSAPATSAKK